MATPDTEEETIRRIENYFESTIIFESFLGAIVFAGLVLVLQNTAFITNATDAPEGFLQLVLFVMGLTSGLAAITAWLGLHGLTMYYSSMEGRMRVYGLARRTGSIVWGSFFITISLLVYPVNSGLAVGIIVVNMGLFLWVNRAFKQAQGMK